MSMTLKTPYWKLIFQPGIICIGEVITGNLVLNDVFHTYTFDCTLVDFLYFSMYLNIEAATNPL